MTPINNTRADRTGQELLSSGSLMLLLHLGLANGRTPWGVLKNFRAAYALTELDVKPMVDAGWVRKIDSRLQGGAFSVEITDAGNAILRGLLAWAKLEAGGDKS